MTKGIDISTHQKSVDYKTVKESGIQFAMLRCGYGKEFSQKDEMFERHYAGCKRAGIPVGAFHYSYATTPAAAKKEAQCCIAFLKGKQFEYPIAYDIEEAATFRQGKSVVSAIARTFCEELEKVGYYVCIYSSASPLKNYFENDILNDYDLWCAEWGSTKPSVKCGIWQYTATGKVDGIKGDVDRDEAYKDYPAIMKAFHLNGYSDEPEQTDLPSRGYWVQGDTDTFIYKVSKFMYKVFPAYTSERAVSHLFNRFLTTSIKEFQRRTGLDDDGLIGELTLKELKKYGY